MGGGGVGIFSSTTSAGGSGDTGGGDGAKKGASDHDIRLSSISLLIRLATGFRGISDGDGGDEEIGGRRDGGMSHHW